MRIASIVITHWAATLAGAYFVGAAAQGAADGLGTAPAWLVVVDAIVTVLLFPLVLLAVSVAPEIRVFSLPALAAFASAAALNSTLVVVGGWLLWRRLTRR
jgi:hypothetical protein